MNTHQGEKANDDAYDTGATAVERKDRGICLHACRGPEAGTFTALPGSLGKQLEHPVPEQSGQADRGAVAGLHPLHDGDQGGRPRSVRQTDPGTVPFH